MLLYIDDIFIIWKSTKMELGSFHQYDNGLVDPKSPQFGMWPCQNTFSRHVIFLQCILHYPRCQKNGQKYGLLHASSYHPDSLKRCLQYSQFLLIRHILSLNRISTEVTPQKVWTSDKGRAMDRCAALQGKRKKKKFCGVLYRIHSLQLWH